MTPAERIMQFFTYDHLPENLQVVSKPFAILAQQMVANVAGNPEHTVGLRKLLEAKDCFVRAVLYKDE